MSAANDVWGTDFKGWFRTGDGRRCDPFTLTDAHSRYLLRCQAVARPDEENVRPIFESAFKDHGLPLAIRSDNGPPFASPGVGGLSRLAVWWIKLGIRVERIEPGKPPQNGRHERRHRTLKPEVAMTPAGDRRSQQRELRRFRQEDNQVRPQEALGRQTVCRSRRRGPIRTGAGAGVSRPHAGAQGEKPGRVPLEEARGVLERGAMGRASGLVTAG